MLVIISCGGSGDGNDVPQPPVEVNLLDTWNVIFTPDQCPEQVHEGLAIFPSNQGNTRELGASRIEMQSLGCPGDFRVIITARLAVVGYPSSVTEVLFLEMLSEHFTFEGDYTIQIFSEEEITFHRDDSAANPESSDNGVFQLTR